MKVVDGHLTGRTTTDFPLIYAPVPQNIDNEDDFHSVDVRIRSSAAGELAVIRSNADELNFDNIIKQNSDSPPMLSAKVSAGDAFQTLAITSSRAGTMPGKYLLLRPVNAAGATFEIEFVREVSQQEHRAMVPSGIGWQGLGGIYRETIVSRSPEVFSIDVNIPASMPGFRVNLGTTEPEPLTFKVTAASGGNEQTVLERTITTPHRWEPRVDRPAAVRRGEDAALLAGGRPGSPHRFLGHADPRIPRRSAAGGAWPRPRWEDRRRRAASFS